MPRLKPATRDIGIDRLQAEQSQTEDCRQFNQSNLGTSSSDYVDRISGYTDFGLE
jgi:hypothetical protein